MKQLASTGGRMVNSRLFYPVFLLVAMLWLLYMLVAYHAIQSHAAAHEEPAALSIEEVGQATIYSISADGIIRLDNY